MAREEAASGAGAIGFGWPMKDGKPLAMVTFSMSELIPTVQYGNCKVGPVEVTRMVEDTEEQRDQAFAECVRDVEAVLATERDKIIEAVTGPRKA